jgi:hypothetical protein
MFGCAGQLSTPSTRVGDMDDLALTLREAQSLLREYMTHLDRVACIGG